MILTIDTSALLAVLLNEEHRSEIIAITKGYDLQAPETLDAEVGNALSAMFKRNRLRLKSAREVIKQFESIPIRRTKIRINESIDLAYKYQIYAYDAYVLDCALQYKTPLLSLDSALTTVAEKLNIDLLEVL